MKYPSTLSPNGFHKQKDGIVLQYNTHIMHYTVETEIGSKQQEEETVPHCFEPFNTKNPTEIKC